MLQYQEKGKTPIVIISMGAWQFPQHIKGLFSATNLNIYPIVTSNLFTLFATMCMIWYCGRDWSDSLGKCRQIFLLAGGGWRRKPTYCLQKNSRHETTINGKPVCRPKKEICRTPLQIFPYIHLNLTNSIFPDSFFFWWNMN